jgi:hypothetical protein
MGFVSYLGFLVLTLFLGVAVRWLDPSFLEQLARKTGLRATHGWALLVVAAAWMFLPFLAGARATDGHDLWLVGPALAGVGFYLSAFAVTSIDEYRLLGRAERVSPADVSVGDGTRLVATSETPLVDDGEEARSPITGRSAVHTDWILQRRERVLGFGRKSWQNVATDAHTAGFTLGGRVRVQSGRHRVFSGVDDVFTFDPDDPLPETVASFLRERGDVPNPDQRDAPLRVIETVVPANRPVTAVGTPTQGDRPGEVQLDSAPADLLLGSHADRSTPGDDPEVILIQGQVEEAVALLKKRVYGVGIGSLALILGGQAVGFAFSSATVRGLL